MCVYVVCVGAYMHVCMLSVYMCVRGGCIPAHVCRGKRRRLSVLFYHFLPIPLRQSLSLNLELGQKPASPRNPAVSVSQKMLWLQEGTAIPYMSPGDLNSVPYACSASSQCYPLIYLPSPLSSMWLVSTCHSGRSAPWQLKYIS